MNKLFTKIAALALGATMAVGVGVAVASKQSVSPVEATDVLYKTVEFTSGNCDTGTSDYTHTAVYTDEITVNCVNFNNNTQKGVVGWEVIKCGRKPPKSGSGASVASIVTTSALSEAITKVTVTIDAITSEYVNSIKLYSSSDGSSWTAETTNFDKTSSGAKSVSLASPDEDLYYKVEFDCAEGTANGFVTVSKIQYYKASNEPQGDPVVSFETNGGSSVPSQTVTSGSYATRPATDPTKQYYRFVNWYADSNFQNLFNFATTQITTDTTVYAKWALDVAHAGTQADPYTVADARLAIDANDGKTGVYATGVVTEIVEAYSSQHSNISFNFVDEGGSDTLEAYRCTGTDAADVTVGDTVVVSGNLTKYGTTYEFASGCILQSLTHPTVETYYDVTFDSNGGTDPEAKSVGEGLTFQFPSPGTKANHIFTGWTLDHTHYFQEGNTSDAVESDLDFVADWQTKGTQTDPYTIAEAKAAVDANAGVKNACIKGYISQIDSYQSSTITYWISADGTTTNQFEVYKGKGLNGASFSSVDDLTLGDYVIVSGNIKLYSAVYEFDSNSSILSMVTPITIQYNNNGGSGSMSNTVSLTGSATAAACTFTAPEGKIFDKWNTESNGSGTSYAAGATITASCTLYAIWKNNGTDVLITIDFYNYIDSIELDLYGANADIAYIYIVTEADPYNGIAGFSWTSSDDTIASVDAEEEQYDVFGWAVGTATLTGTKAGYQDAILTVTVVDSTPTITFTSPTTTVGKGSKVTNTATGTNLGGASISYSSGNTSIATVNSSTGEVTGVAAGSTTITASVTVDETPYSANYTITVVDGWTLSGQYILTSEGSYKTSGTTYEFKVEFNGVSGTLGSSASYTFAAKALYVLTIGPSSVNDQYLISITEESTTYYLRAATKSTLSTTTDSTDTTALWELNETADGIVATNATTKDGDKDIVLQFNPNNGSNPRFAAYSSTQKAAYFLPYDKVAKAGEFTERYMHVDIPTSETGESTGYQTCKGAGYYDVAKTQFNLLADDVRAEFVQNSKFADYYLRLLKWAAANTDSFGTYEGRDNVLYTPERFTVANSILNVESANAVTIVVIVSVISLTAIGGYIFLRRRKEQ